MKILVQPAKGSYKLLFYDGKHVVGVGIVDMTETPKGPRPVRYRLRWGSRKDYQATPSKDLISQLRESEVRMVKPDAVFEEFMKAFQIRSGRVEACRMCLLDDRYTPINDDNHVIFGKGERICLDCGRRELRRELAPLGHMGRETLKHFEELLVATRNLDRVLALVQPEHVSMKSALFDRIEAHPVLKTASLMEAAAAPRICRCLQGRDAHAGPAARRRGRPAARKRSPRGCGNREAARRSSARWPG